MQNFFKSFFLLIFLILGACSSDRAPKINVHQKKNLNPDREEPVVKYDLAFFKEYSIEELEGSADKASEERIELLQKLGKELFLPSRMSEQEYLADQDIHRYLRAYNTILLSLENELYSNDKVQGLYTQYEAWLFEDCKIEEIKGCKNHGFFKRDPQTASVLLVLGKWRSNVNIRTAYRYYTLATNFESSRKVNLELNTVIVAQSIEFFASFIDVVETSQSVTLSHKSDLTELQREFLSQVTGLVTSALELWSDISKDDRVQDILPRYIKWYESGSLETALSRNLAESISAIIQSSLKSDALWNAFLQSVERDQRSDGSYRDLAEELQSTGGKLLNVLKFVPIKYSKIKENKDDVIYLYFVTQLMAGRDSGQLKNFWEASEQNVDRLLDILESVVKVDLITTVKFSNSKMAEYQQEHKRRGYSPGILIDKLKEWSQTRVEPKWTIFHSRILRLRTYFEAYIEGNATFRSQESVWSRIKETRRVFDRINDNIKLLVTYPNIIILGYLASKLDFNMVLRGMGMKITVNKDVILDQLVKGLIPPFFKYTRYELDDEGIDTVQIQYAMYYSIVTGLLDDHGIDPKDFLRVFFSKYLDRDRHKIRVWIRRFLNIEKEGSRYDQAMAACRAIDQGQVEGVVNSIRFQDLRFYSFFGYEGHANSSQMMNETSSVIAATNMSRAFDEAIELLRSDVDPKLRQLYLLKQMFLQGGQLSAVAAVESLFGEIEAMRNITLQKAQEIYGNLRGCLRKISGIEYRRRREILDFEREFSLHMFDGLSALQNLRDHSSKTVSELKSIAPEEPLFKSRFFDDLDGSKTLLEALNHKLLNLELYKPAMEAIAGYKDDMKSLGGFHRSADGRYYFSARRFDLYTRIAGYLINGFNGRDLSVRPDRIDLKFPNSMNELRQIILLWFNDSEPKFHMYAYDGDSREVGKDLFKRRFLQYFLNKSTWFRDLTGPAHYLRNAWRIEIALLKYEAQLELDLAKIMNCDQTCIKMRYIMAKNKVKAHHIEVLKDLERFNLNEEDVNLLNELQIPSFFPSHTSVTTSGPKYLFVTEGIRDVMRSPFDESFNYMVSIRLGENPEFRGYLPYSESSWKPKDSNAGGEREITPEIMMGRLNPYYWALEYFESLRDAEDNLLFPVEKQVREMIQTHFTEQLFNDMRLVDSYLKAVDETVENWSLESIQFTLREPVFEGFEPISSGLVGQYFQDIRRFNSSTQNLFVPIEYQSDAKWSNYFE